MGSNFSGEFTGRIFKRHSEDGGIQLFKKSIYSRLFSDCVEGNNPIDFWIEIRS